MEEGKYPEACFASLSITNLVSEAKYSVRNTPLLAAGKFISVIRGLIPRSSTTELTSLANEVSYSVGIPRCSAARKLINRTSSITVNRVSTDSLSVSRDSKRVSNASNRVSSTHNKSLQRLT